MIIEDLKWNDRVIEHIISRHNVDPEEVEEVFQHYHYILKGRQDTYQIFGQSLSGRYLWVVIKYIGKGEAGVITAREMTWSEQKLFKKKRRDKK
ncbi:MAG: hypothetical protein ACREOW_03335 [Thermodesulfobacteriota bacterium]